MIRGFFTIILNELCEKQKK